MFLADDALKTMQAFALAGGCMCFEYLGVLGLLLILIAWIPETLQNYKEKGKSLNLKFVMLYMFGSLFLSYHAYALKDMVFFILNGLATVLGLFNFSIILLNKQCPKGGKEGAKKRKK